ncbi:MAG: polysaccharide biosynthesis C-terminal domain-containing protein [Tannerella sp.]|jgi:O-antigen/teichoic acid export membrane protein|nr:polysaccharide biosynthesis C-terminal domain-containing protein [Tannerella sp.]
MLKDIIGTVGARYLVAFFNLPLIFINGKVLGREGMGIVGLIYASANLAVIFNSIFCENTIVYFMNKYSLRYVFYPAYIWSLTGSFVSCGVMAVCGMLPENYEWTVLALAVLISLTTANSMFLLGADKVKIFNLMFIIQGTGLFLTVIFLYYIAGFKNINGYMTGLFSAYSIAFVYSCVSMFPLFGKQTGNKADKSLLETLKEMSVYGLWSCVDNLAEGLTTRLNYFLIRHWGGYGNVGLLDSGTKISESVWHISSSVSYVEYKEVSKTSEKEIQKNITIKWLGLTFCALTAVMLIVVFIPEWLYTEYLLSAEFAGIRKIIIGLSVGIVAFGSNRILSHYFTGSGKVKYSAYSSITGLAVLLIAGYILIPKYGVSGAAITTSIAYCCMLLFSIIVFMKQTNTKFGDFFRIIRVVFLSHLHTIEKRRKAPHGRLK